MVNRQLVRVPGDHALYALEGVGTLRLEGVSSSRATAEAAGRQWHFARRGFWRQLHATDAAGVTSGFSSGACWAATPCAGPTVSSLCGARACGESATSSPTATANSR